MQWLHNNNNNKLAKAREREDAMKYIAKIVNKVINFLGGVTKEDHLKEVGSLKEMINHLQEGRELDHTPEGVGHLFAQLAIDAVQDTIGDAKRPMGGATRADILEIDQYIWQRCGEIKDELTAFIDGIKTRNDTCVQWGVRGVRCGVSRMMANAYYMHSKLLLQFARIWSKEHKDDTQKRLLTSDQIKKWKSLSKRDRESINYAVKHGFYYW